MPVPDITGKKTPDTAPDENEQRIVVIGASSGGFEALKTIIRGLPADFGASIFIVWHISPFVRGVLPDVLNKMNSIFAANAYDGEPIKPNRIYVAPVDHHLLVEEGHVRVTRGPKENRFRPAIDPLFRSAGYAYGNRVIGVILSGALDDGTAGLWIIKKYGGTTIVQDPADAEVPSMPESALREVQIDHCVPVAGLADLLTKLTKKRPDKKTGIMKDEETKKEIGIAAEEHALNLGLPNLSQLTPFACPKCHGVLSKIREGNLTRFRCPTGHGYSADTLLASLTERIEDSLYKVLRGMDESILLLNHIGDHYAEIKNSRVAAMYFKKAKEAADRSKMVRKAVLANEQLSKDSLWQQASRQETA